MLSSRRRRSASHARRATVHDTLLAATALLSAQRSRLHGALRRRASNPRFFVMRFRSPKPASIQSRSPTCIRAPSHRTSSTDCIDTTTWPGLSRSNPIQRPQCRKSRPTFACGQIKLRPGIYFQDDPAFKGQKRELTAHGLRLFVQALFRSALEVARIIPRYQRKEDQSAWHALRDEALKSKKPFDYDRRSRRHACARPIHDAVQVGRTASALSAYCSHCGDLYGAVAREVVEAYGDEIPAQSGRNRSVSPRRMAALVADRARAQSDVSGSASTTPSRMRTTWKARRCCSAFAAGACR